MQGATSIPVLLGIPVIGYINLIHPKAGYYFSFVTTIIGKKSLPAIAHNPLDQFNFNSGSTSHCKRIKTIY